MNLWNLLPPAVATRAKAVTALIGAAVTVLLVFLPQLSGDKWVVVVTTLLTALGVHAVPNSNAQTEHPGGLLGPDGKPYVYRGSR